MKTYYVKELGNFDDVEDDIAAVKWIGFSFTLQLTIFISWWNLKIVISVLMSAHEPLAWLMGELIYKQASSSVGVHRPHSLNISSETTRPIEAKFHFESLW